MRNKMNNKSLIIFFGLILLIVSSYFTYHIVPYIVVNFQYEKIAIENNLSKKDIEDILFLYSSRRIPIEESLWGKENKLKKDEECWQYLILWKEPIDIVYNAQERVVKIFASFE